jgi:hypothetical protein
VGASGNRDCALCGRHGMDTPRNQSHSRFGNERPGQVGGYWSSGGRGGLGMFCLGRPTSPKGHDRVKLKGRRSHSAWLSCPPSSSSGRRTRDGRVPLRRCSNCLHSVTRLTCRTGRPLSGSPSNLPFLLPLHARLGLTDRDKLGES